jgi:Zn-dependent protease
LSATGLVPRSLALRLDISWLPTFVLVLWWFASIALPARLEDLSQPVHWLLALTLTLGLLVSVTLHEVAHALVEARYGGNIEPVRLYPFGGVRQRDAGAQGAEAEFMVALAGPAFSLLTAFGLLVASRLTGAGATFSVLLLYLAALNAGLAFLNLIPAFPLDGGRALRAVLWTLREDFSWAATISVRLGSTFGLFLVILGIYIILSDGGPVGGMTTLLLGFTLRNAATFSYRDLLARRSLHGVAVSRFMDENPITVQRALSIAALAEDFIYKHQLKMLPVVDGDRLMGYVTAERVKELPREEWSRQSIGTIALPFSAETTVGPDTEAIEALDKMTRSGLSRLMVVDQERLAGTVSLQALLGASPVAAATEVEA